MKRLALLTPFIFAGCESMGISSGGGADAAQQTGDALSTIGAATGNPILLAGGGILTAVAVWLRTKKKGPPGP